MTTHDPVAAQGRNVHRAARLSLDTTLYGTLAYPVVTGLALIHLGTGRFRIALLLLEMHCASYVVCLVAWGTFSLLGGDILVHVPALAAEFCLVVAGRTTSHPPWPWLAPAATVAVIAGFLIGAVAWSGAVPRRVLAAAERTAAGEPYCLVSRFTRATRPEHLRGFAVLEPEREHGFFHLLLVVGPSSDRRFFNWSFSRLQFDPVSSYARQSLRFRSPSGLDGVDWCGLPVQGSRPDQAILARLTSSPLLPHRSGWPGRLASKVRGENIGMRHTTHIRDLDSRRGRIALRNSSAAYVDTGGRPTAAPLTSARCPTS